MPHVCLLYHPEDGQSWQRYFTNLLNKSKLTHVSHSLNESAEDLGRTFSECHVVVLILTSNLVESLSEPNHPIHDKLNDHQRVAVISWSSLKEDLAEVKKVFSNSSQWRELLSEGSAEECKQIVADLAGIVDEQEGNKKKKKRRRRITIEVLPDRVHKCNEKIAIIFQEVPSGTVQVKLEGGEFIDCKRRNDYTYTFKAPLHDFGVTKLTVYVDAKDVHQCPFTYQTPSLEAFRSISFLAQALGITKDNMEELDRKLVEIYESSMPADLSLHQAASSYMTSNKVGRSDFGIPTLLHFAAQYGLTELCCAVLDTPGSLAAFHIENKDGLDPAQIADKEGFHELANFIRMFVETAAVIEVSDELYLSMTGEHLYNNRSEIAKEPQEDTEKQVKLHSAHTSKTKKKLPPVPRKHKSVISKPVSQPIIEEETEESKQEKPKRKQLPPPPGRLSTSMSDQNLHVLEEESETLEPSPPPARRKPSPPPARRKPSPPPDRRKPSPPPDRRKPSPPPVQRKPSPPPVQRKLFKETEPTKPEEGNRGRETQHSSTEERKRSPRSLSPAEFMGMTGEGLNIQKSPGSLGSSSLEELIEIQRGVSEKEFSIEEAEQLYGAWKERNRSLRMSIKDRHRGLQEMRDTYATVITQAKMQGERRSLFERLKSTFGARKSSKPEIVFPQPSIKHTTYERVTDWTNRTSTLSSSSSASGSSRDSRMSISSQDSVYNSTDSESEEDEPTKRRGKLTAGETSNPKLHQHSDQQRGQIYSMAKRMSYKEHYLQQSISVDKDGPPPVPPRGSKPK